MEKEKREEKEEKYFEKETKEIKVTIVMPDMIKDTLPDKRGGVRAPAN